MEKNNKQVQVGVAIIVRHPTCERYFHQVLMGVRKGSHGAGTWSFPGGHIEFGESVEGAAKRELYEETGLDVPLSEFHRVGYVDTVFKTADKHYITLYLLVEYDFNKGWGEPKLMEPDKCEGWVWTREKPFPLFEPISDSKINYW